MILITGATNFIGRAVAQRLADANYNICCLLKPSHREQKLPTSLSFTTVSAHFADPPALRTAMQDATAVIHVTREQDFDQEGQLSDHTRHVEEIVQAMKETDVPRLIYLSRLNAERSSAYPLLRVKGEAEAIIEESGLDYTILRSAVVYGAEDAFTNVLVMGAKMLPLVLPIPDAGRSRFQPLWVGDLARCITDTLERDDLIGKTIPLGGAEHFTLEQMIAEILQVAGMRRLLLHVRIPLIKAAIGFFNTFLVRNPTPRWWLDIVAVGSATSLGAIPRRFDFEPCRFADCLEYLKEKRPWRRDFFRFVMDYD